MASPFDYETLATRWPLTENQRGSPELDALIEGVLNLTREERDIRDGRYFYISTIRQGVPAGDVTYRVMRSNLKSVGLEDLTVDADYSQLGNGTYTVSVQMYVQGSKRNEFTYDLGTIVKAGTNLNCARINEDPDSDLILDPQNVTITGDPDFQLYYSQVFVNLQGNNNLIGGSSGDFFDKNRKILIPPNTDILLATRTSGSANGGVDLISSLGFTEQEVRV